MIEDLINRAQELLENIDGKDAVDMLAYEGVRPELGLLVVKAALILREPYVYQEREGRIVTPESL